jgi:hypothetical protein
METSSVFVVDQEKLNTFIRKQLFLSLLIKALIYIVIIVALVLYLKMEGVGLWFFVGTMIFLLGLFSWLRTSASIKHAHQIWNNYRLEVYRDRLVKQQPLYPDMSLLTSELRVKAINRQGHFLIGSSPNQELLIPSFLNDYPGAIQMLGLADQGIESKSISQWVQVLSNWSMIPLMIGMMGSANRWIVLVCGTILLLAFGYAVYRIYTSELYDQKTKKRVFRYSIYFLFFLFLVLYKFFGDHPGPIYSFIF